MATVDVTVMGAGIFGLSVAYACAKRGARVQVIDPDGIGSGASGGIIGALAPHVPENWNTKKQFQLESLLMAELFWADVEAATGLATGYVRSGRLQPLVDENATALARARAETARELWRDAARWDVVSATGQEWEPPSPTGLLVHDTLSALIHPRRATRALAEAVKALGGTLTVAGSPAGAIVWATGWRGLVEMSQNAPRQIGNGVKGQAALLGYNAERAPQLFADTLHFIPHLDGTVAIGSTSERDFKDANQTDQALDDLLERAYRAMPILKQAPVLERWAGVRPRSRSRAPMLGRHPHRKGEFVANGGFKIGFGMAPKVGEVMADLILEDRVTYPAEFDVSANL